MIVEVDSAGPVAAEAPSKSNMSEVDVEPRGGPSGWASPTPPSPGPRPGGNGPFPGDMTSGTVGPLGPATSLAGVFSRRVRLFVLFPVVALVVLAGVFIAKTRAAEDSLRRHGVVTTAVVVGTDHHGDNDYLRVRLQECACVVEVAATNLAGHPAGTTIPVRYDPDRPGRAEALVDRPNPYEPVFGVAGGVILSVLILVPLLLAARRRRRRALRLVASTAPVMQVSVDAWQRVVNRTPITYLSLHPYGVGRSGPPLLCMPVAATTVARLRADTVFDLFGDPRPGGIVALRAGDLVVTPAGKLRSGDFEASHRTERSGLPLGSGEPSGAADSTLSLLRDASEAKAWWSLTRLAGWIVPLLVVTPLIRLVPDRWIWWALGGVVPLIVVEYGVVWRRRRLLDRFAARLPGLPPANRRSRRAARLAADRYLSGPAGTTELAGLLGTSPQRLAALRSGMTRRLVAACAVITLAMVGVIIRVATVDTTVSNRVRSNAAVGNYHPPLDANGDPLYLPPAPPPADRAATATLPAAFTATTPSGPIVTPAMAADVVQAAWTLHSRALSHFDTGLMASFETGTALEIDRGRCQCSQPGDPFGPIRGLALSVPRQTAYPARFFAQVATTASHDPWIAFLVFTRHDPSSPWLLTLMGGFSPDQAIVTPPATDRDGYLAPQTAPPTIDPTIAHHLLADYWRHAKDRGSVPDPAPFAPGLWTTDFAAKLAVHHQGDVAANGLTGYYTYQADTAPDATFVFPEGQGWQIACSAIRIQKTYTAGPTGAPFQDAARHNWGSAITPGVHAAIVDTEITVPCIEIPSAGSTAGARVLGANEYTSATEGRDAAPRSARTA